jgi:hypothetical protein
VYRESFAAFASPVQSSTAFISPLSFSFQREKADAAAGYRGHLFNFSSWFAISSWHQFRSKELPNLLIL